MTTTQYSPPREGTTYRVGDQARTVLECRRKPRASNPGDLRTEYAQAPESYSIVFVDQAGLRGRCNLEAWVDWEGR